MTVEYQAIVEAFNKLGATSSKKEKERILGLCKEMDDFKEVLQFLYNPFIITGIGKKKMDKFKDTHYTHVKEFQSFQDVLDYVVENNTGRDETLNKVSNYINQQPEEYREFLRLVITKELKVGITATTINKVYGKNWIPKFDVMLAEKWEEYNHVIKNSFIIMKKLDGIRCIIVRDEDGVKFFTRKGKPIIGLVELEEEILRLDFNNFVMDGELLNVNHKGVDSKTLFRETGKRVRKDGEKRDIEFHAFDFLSLAEFEDGYSEKVALDRKIELKKVIESTGFSFIKNVDILYLGDDKSKVKEYLDIAIENKEEGVMVMDTFSKYYGKRVQTMLKVKQFEDIDLRVKSVYEGQGENKGKLGGVVVSYKGYDVGVGSGFSKEERERYWNNPEEIIGEIIHVQYFEESQNEQGGLSLRFPTFQSVRFDKDEPDA